MLNAFPKVSVIVPVYNLEQYLPRFIDTLKAQKYSNFEVLFIDDASGDASVQIIEAAGDPRFRVIRQSENRGAGAARNVGIDEAAGDYLYFADGDDELTPDLLQAATEEMEKTGADIVGFGFTRLFPDGTLKQAEGVKNVPKGASRTEFSYRDRPDTIMTDLSPVPWNKLYSRAFVRENGLRFEEISTLNDITFSGVSLAKAGKIAWINKNLYRYYQTRPGSLSDQKKKVTSNVLIAVNSAYRQVAALPYFSEIRQAAVKFMTDNLYWHFTRFGNDLNDTGTAELYRAMHTLFQDPVFDDWAENEPEQYSGARQFFTVVREQSFEEYYQAWNHKLVVSMTSYPARISCVPDTVGTLLRQTLPADEIVLYLAEEQFPDREEGLPEPLKAMIREGKVTLRWCDDLKPHKKYFYAFRDYPDHLVVTVDDDMIYPEYMLLRLVLSYHRYPDAVSCLRAHLIPFEADGTILPYASWPQGTSALMDRPCMQLLATGCAGVLYPPHIFPELADRKDVILQTCLRADDLWLKLLELHNGVPVVMTSGLALKYVEGSQENALCKDNIGGGQNDAQLQMMIQWYDGEFGKGAFMRRLSDTTIGVPQIGTEAAILHTRSWANREIQNKNMKILSTEARISELKKQVSQARKETVRRKAEISRLKKRLSRQNRVEITPRIPKKGPLRRFRYNVHKAAVVWGTKGTRGLFRLVTGKIRRNRNR